MPSAIPAGIIFAHLIPEHPGGGVDPQGALCRRQCILGRRPGGGGDEIAAPVDAGGHPGGDVVAQAVPAPDVHGPLGGEGGGIGRLPHGPCAPGDSGGGGLGRRQPRLPELGFCTVPRGQRRRHQPSGAALHPGSSLIHARGQIPGVLGPRLPELDGGTFSPAHRRRHQPGNGGLDGRGLLLHPGCHGARRPGSLIHGRLQAAEGSDRPACGALHPGHGAGNAPLHLLCRRGGLPHGAREGSGDVQPSQLPGHIGNGPAGRLGGGGLSAHGRGGLLGLLPGLLQCRCQARVSGLDLDDDFTVSHGVPPFRSGRPRQ